MPVLSFIQGQRKAVLLSEALWLVLGIGLLDCVTGYDVRAPSSISGPVSLRNETHDRKRMPLIIAWWPPVCSDSPEQLILTA